MRERPRQPRDHPRWMPQYAAMRPRAGDKGQGLAVFGTADEVGVLVLFEETTKMNTNNDVELLRLLVRNTPFILARPDVAAASVPDEKSAGGWHEFFIGKRLVFSCGVGLRTLGSLARLWCNAHCPPCIKCGTPSAPLFFGGSFLSGSGKYIRNFCPKCGVGWTQTPRNTVAQTARMFRNLSRQRPFILPATGVDGIVLPKELEPHDLRKVFDGKLVVAYNRAALEEVEAFDKMVREAVESNKAFSATFRLHDGAFGEVCFANINGYAQLFGSAWRGGGGAPVKWDEWWGLLPMLRELATERLAPVFVAGDGELQLRDEDWLR